MPGALIIGAGPGIGAAVARRLAREGLGIGAIARSAAAVDAALGAPGALGGVGALGVTADVTDEDALRGAIDEIAERLGVPEILVYNAALVRRDTIGELTARQQLDAWAVNVVGAITAVAHLADRMAAAGGGTIVLTGGMPEPLPDFTSLSLGKAGVRALTDLLARAYGPAGLHVATVTVSGAVAPGGAFDPDDIAEHYWRLHTQPRSAWEREVIHAGPPSGGADPERIEVLLVSGSSRAGSTNRAVLGTVADLAGPGIATAVLEGIDQLPLFNPDADAEGLAVDPRVAAMRAAVARANAILISTPEYAGALPAAMKNVLEWTIGDAGTYGKPVAWINASGRAAPTGAADAHASLAKVLAYAGADVVADACVRVPISRDQIDERGVIGDPGARTQLATALARLVAHVSRSGGGAAAPSL
jgi:NAD(P)H-dependent FMN reductase/NADP-dependent 3-hydroxy acid dehydrogenase YdfG